jgi:hypothetical protein
VAGRTLFHEVSSKTPSILISSSVYFASTDLFEVCEKTQKHTKKIGIKMFFIKQKIF